MHPGAPLDAGTGGRINCSFMTRTGTDPARREQTRHPRDFGRNRYVYAVVSRRSGGISIGINVNPDKRCNFDCIYCQVDRNVMPPPQPLDLDALFAELDGMLAAARDGSMLAHDRFRDLPDRLKRVRDVALSGDGEPTSVPHFEELAAGVVERVAAADLGHLPVVLITNAAGLDRQGVRKGVARIVATGGQVWAKLDAGTEAFYHKVCGTRVPFRHVLDNLAMAAREHPLTLQTCFFALDGEPPPEGEIDAYIGRVRAILEQGGRIRLIQLYTVARTPAQAVVSPLPEVLLEAIAQRVRAALEGVAVETFA